MKVKKFVASNMPEAMKVIRKDLGDDAVILNSREIETGGFFGLFTKKNIEVIAAIDSAPTVKRPVKREVNNVKQPSFPVVTDTNKSKKKEDEKLVQEIQQLKLMITALTEHKNIENTAEYPGPFQKISDFLEEQEIDKTLRLQIMKNLLKNWYETEEEQISEEKLTLSLKSYMEDLLNDIPMGGIDFKKKYINFVGPTGVGKTTTIAKIAAHCVLKKHKKVALITTDTYRIAAVEQLKTYAKILNIPLEVAYSIDDFMKAKEQFSNYDVVLVDSAGRNFRNPLYIEELKKVIDFNDDVETYLVLALTSKFRDMEAIYNQFSLIDINKLIFTKKDETSYFGCLINMAVKHQIGIAYITTGQNVPDDIIEVNNKDIITTLLEVNHHE